MAAGFGSLLSLLGGMCSSERPAAVQGAPRGAAKQTLDGEDRSAIIAEEGKQRARFRAILKRGTSQTDARVPTIVLSETRGLKLFSVVRGGIGLTKRLGAGAPAMPTIGVDTLPRTRALRESTSQRQA